MRTICAANSNTIDKSGRKCHPVNGNLIENTSMLLRSSPRLIFCRLVATLYLFCLCFGTSLSASAQDLAVTKTAPANATAGDSITYSLSIANVGTAPASGVTLSDALPAGTTFQSLTQTSGPAFTVSKPAIGQRGTISLSRSTLLGGKRNSFAGRNVSSFTQVGNTLFFIVGDGSIGKELWKTDGTATGTMLVKTFSNLPPSANYPPFFPSIVGVNNTLFFAADDGVRGLELWKSDGTASGTVLVKDVNSGASDSKPNYFFNVNGTLFFFADNGVVGRELWKSNGTSSGTVLVKDINPGSDSSSGSSPAVFNGALYFSATDGFSFDGEDGHGYELWKSDGTAAGTTIVKDINQISAGGSYPRWMNVVGSSLFFSASDSDHGTRLWKSNGTSSGTVLVSPSQSGLSGSNPNFLSNVNGTLYFFADASNDAQKELWKSSGIATGTVRVKVFDSLQENSLPGFPVALGNKLLFAVPDTRTGQELWVSDGTASGTNLIKDIYLGAKSSSSTTPVVLNSTAFFTANDGATGQELWKTDGTTSGTVRVKDINFGAGNGAGAVNIFSGKILFTGDDGSGIELWQSDGTATGTLPLRSPGDVAAFNVTVKIDDNFSGPLSNTATASSSSGDANPNNNAATASTQVQALAPVNRAPVLKDASFITAKDTVLSDKLVGTDADGDALSYARVSEPTNGKLTFNANGSFVYTPNALFMGTDSFTATASDGRLTSSPATVTITVTESNRAPVLRDATFDAVQKITLSGQLAGTDADGDVLTYSRVSNPTSGTLTFNANGSFEYQSNNTFVGVDSFKATTSDGKSTSATATITINVKRENWVPNLYDASFNAILNTAFSQQLAGSDPNGDPLTYSITTGNLPAGLTLSPQGLITGTPTSIGISVATIQVDDGRGGTNSARITIEAKTPNRTPTLSLKLTPISPTTNDVLTVVTNAADPDGDGLGVRFVWKKNGVVLTNESGETLRLSDQGNGDKGDVIAVTVSASDGRSGEATASAQTTVINTAPVAVGEKYSLAQRSKLSLNLEASDLDNDTLTYAVAANPDHGQLTVSREGRFDYTPNALFYGTDSFTFTATDGEATSPPATITLDVTRVNAAPTLSEATFNVVKNVPFAQQLAGADADGDALTYRIAAGVLPPGLNLSPDGLLSGTPTEVGTRAVRVEVSDGKGGLGAARITIDVALDMRPPTLSVKISPDDPRTNSTLTVIENATDPTGSGLSYSAVWRRNGVVIPGENLNKLDLFKLGNGDKGDLITVEVTARNGNGASATASAQARILNSQPTAGAASFLTTRGQSVSGRLVGADPDNDALTFANVSGPAHGSVILNADGSFNYAPLSGFVGNDAFTYRVSDGDAVSEAVSVNITVNKGNDAPTLADVEFDATMGISFSKQLLGTDADGDPLTYAISAGNLSAGLNLSASGLITGTPTQTGSSVVNVEVSDSKGGKAIAQITIVVEAAPVSPKLEPTLSPISPKTNDTLTVTPNGDAAFYAYIWKKNDTVISGERGATLNLAKTGNGDKNDVITCEVTATNASGGTATASAQVTVANSAPIAISSHGEVAAATEKAFVLQAYDADGDALTYKRVGGPRNGVTADIRVDPTDGKTKLFYRSRPFYGGVDIIRFVVFDSSNKQSNESTLGINVLYTPPPPANRAPIAGDTSIDTYVGKSEIKGLLGSDPDGDAISFRIVGNAKYGTSEIRRDKDGQFKLFYSSLNRFYGDDRVTYLVTDSRGKESNLATVNIHFINRAPLAQGNRIGVAAGAPVAQYLFGTDEDGDALSFRLVNNPRYGKGEIKRDPQGKWRFYYQSLPGYVGPDQITFIAIDPLGKESPVAAIDINVVKTSSTSSALQAGAAPSGGGS